MRERSSNEMSDLKSQVRELGATIESKKADAAEAFKSFDALRSAATAEGVDFAKNTEAFDRLDNAGKAYDSIRDEVAGLESRRARLLEIAGEKAVEIEKKQGPKAAAATFGEAFINSDTYAALKNRLGMSSNVPVGTTDAVQVMDRAQMKTLVGVTVPTTVGGSAYTPGLSGIPEKDRQAGIVMLPQVGLDFLNVISTGTTDSDVVEWIKESTFTNGAVETAEGADAAESNLKYETVTTNVREIATFIPVTRRALADVAFAESEINNRLAFAVRARLQAQVLNGGGTGQDLKGLYGTTGIGSVDISSDAAGDILVALHKAITNIRVNAYMEPDFIGLHPEDWEDIVLQRADSVTAADGKGSYLHNSALLATQRTINGVPVIVHAAFTNGSPMVGVGREATLWVREGLSISASDSHSDYFIKRQVAILATLRAAFGVQQPKAFCKVVA